MIEAHAPHYPYRDGKSNTFNPQMDKYFGHPSGMRLKAIFAKRIRDARLTRDWSQAKLGEKAGVSQSTVSRAEDADGAASDLDTVEQICDALAIAPWKTLNPKAKNSPPPAPSHNLPQFIGETTSKLSESALARLAKLVVHFGNLSDDGQEALVGDAYKLVMAEQRSAPPPPEEGGPMNLTKELQPNGSKAGDHHQGEGQRRRKKSR